MKRHIKFFIFCYFTSAMTTFPEQQETAEAALTKNQEAATSSISTVSLEHSKNSINTDETEKKIAQFLSQLAAEQPQQAVKTKESHKRKQAGSIIPEPQPLTINRKSNLIPAPVRKLFKPKKQLSLTTNLPFTLKGLTGVIYSPKIYNIINQLKRVEEGYALEILNRLILYGPPGNGKTALARAIAEAAGCAFMTLKGPNIVTSYLGQGAENINKIFEDAQKHFEETGQPVVIFMDEIDAISRSNNYETAARSEHQVATQALWTTLDDHKKSSGIFLICATNHFDKLDQTFLARFSTNAIEISNPNEAIRKSILVFYLNQHKISLDNDLLQDLIKKTDGLSIRDLEYLVNDIAIAPQIYGPENVDEDTIWDILKESRKKYASAKKSEPFAESTTRKILDYSSLALNFYHIALISHTGYNFVYEKYWKPRARYSLSLD